MHYLPLLFDATLQLQVRKDGQAARTQIQLATKNSPSLVERYFIYVSQDVAKKLKSECEWFWLAAEGGVHMTAFLKACGMHACWLALQQA
jgi:hypothetical protein